MPPPQFKPETKHALKAVLLALNPDLLAAENLVTLRTQEFERARQQLAKAQFDVDTLQAKRKALRQDLGDEP